MPNLTDLPYANWLEQSLANFVGLPVTAICICTKFENGEVGTGYWDCSMSDKLLFSGIIQQDAMLDTMRENGWIPTDEEDEDDTED